MSSFKRKKNIEVPNCLLRKKKLENLTNFDLWMHLIETVKPDVLKTIV